jgi:hypothetical protein
MNPVNYYAISGLNLYNNPLNQEGALIRSVNVDSNPLGAKVKRPGYGTFLGTVSDTRINTLFSWENEAGSLNVYAASGGTLYYSAQGTAPWAICGNGTITSGSNVGYTILNNTLTISQNGGTTRYSTNGTSFTDTPLAPAGGYLEQYHNRIYITGTSSDLFYSVTNDPTNWNTSGTSDSSSITIPGAGIPNKLFKLADRLNINKNSNATFRWDDTSLIDLATNNGMSSPYSYGTVEDNGFWLNPLGMFVSSGAAPQLISNQIQRFIYNDQQTGINGTAFGSAQGVVHKYDYLLAVGSVRDDFTNEPLDNAILKYNYQKNEFLNYQFGDAPTALHSFEDATGVKQLIFGDATGQVYQYGNSTTDNGKPISSVMEFIYHFSQPQLDKEMRWFWGFFNPGCEAQVQIAIGSTFTRGAKKWIDLGDATSGVVQYRFPSDTRGRILYLRIKESSKSAPFSYYGCSFQFNAVNPG